MANAFRLPRPPSPAAAPWPAETPASTDASVEDAAEAGRLALLARRGRGRAGTVRTGWRGLLDLRQTAQRKTLLGD